jgi:hypothetical protein
MISDYEGKAIPDAMSVLFRHLAAVPCKLVCDVVSRRAYDFYSICCNNKSTTLYVNTEKIFD